MKAEIRQNDHGRPWLLLVPDNDEVEIHEQFEGNVHKGFDAVLTPGGLRQALTLAGPGTRLHEEAWNLMARPGVIGPNARVRSRYGHTRQRPWSAAEGGIYRLDYDQWQVLRGPMNHRGDEPPPSDLLPSKPSLAALIEAARR